MTVIFKAKTNERHVFKILAELLQNNIMTACFEIDEKGIRLRMMDNQRTVLIDLDLQADNFQIYKFTNNEKLTFGINLTHFHKMLKSTKKRDSLELFIDDTNATELCLKIIPNEKNKVVTTSFIKIQNIQNIEVILPEGYVRPVSIASSSFQKMCKRLPHVSSITTITAKGSLLRFSNDAGNVIKSNTEFGEMESDEENDEKIHTYDEKFDTEQLIKIMKISGLGQVLQVYTKTDNPLLIKTNVGSLGKISIFLKSKSIQEAENRCVEIGNSEEEN